jgi:hypothetical protein
MTRSALRRGLRGVALAASLAPGAVTAQAPERLVLVGAMLLDGSGGAPLPGARIIIENGRFTCVSGPSGCPALPGDRELDLTGRWLTPGLIDTHVHLPFTLAPEGLPRLQRLRFALGITTVRDGDSRALEAILAERPGAENGTRPVPRLVVAARVTPEYAERFGAPLGAPLVERLVAMGVDAIKIKEPFDGEIWREEISAARAAGRIVYGHTWGGPPPPAFLRGALDEGIDGVSHLMAFALESQPPGADLTPPDSAADIWAWHKDLWLSAEPAALDTLIGELVRRGVWLEPTLAAEYYWGRPIDPPDGAGFLRQPRRLRELLGLGAEPKATDPAYPASWARQSAFVGDFIRRGGMVVAGTDGASPGIDLHEEMRLIGQAAGVPMAGLVAATRDAGRAIGRPDLGTIETGKLADAVVYAADPLGGPGASVATVLVIKGGVVHDADSLRAEFQAEYQARVRTAWRGRLVRGAKLLGLLLAVALAGAWLIRRRR